MMAGMDRVYGGLIPFELTVYGAGDDTSRNSTVRQEIYGIGLGDSMIHVNRYGRRVCCEKWAGDSHVEHHVRDPESGECPNRLTFQIHDQRTADQFDVAGPVPHIIRAETLPQLAAEFRRRLRAVRDYTDDYTLDDTFDSGLKSTIERFNEYARTGVDLEFGRGSWSRDLGNHLRPLWEKSSSRWQREGKTQAECLVEFREQVVARLSNPYPSLTMYPIAEHGPYYGIIIGTNAVDTAGGPEVDESGQVLAEDGRAVPRLFGAGSCVNSPSNGGYWGGGMALSLALSTGWVAGESAMKAQALPIDAIPAAGNSMPGERTDRERARA
jgi:3-oxosteroid 1-dehydrogenase